MLRRKIEPIITEFMTNKPRKILLIDGARQIGKTYIIRHLGKRLFPHFVEINLLEDTQNFHRFQSVQSVQDFYVRLSALVGNQLGTREDTLIFLDEIQECPALLTLLKFLNEDDRFNYIVSGSQLGVALHHTSSIPMGSIDMYHMYPMDFEEFLWANGVGAEFIDYFATQFQKRECVDEILHNDMMRFFRQYLLVGGLPEAVQLFVTEHNIAKVQHIQSQTHTYYGIDAAKYDSINRLKIRRVYDYIPSILENKKKRIIVQSIENKKGKRFSDYQEEFDYLIAAGIALDVKAISTPKFPLLESCTKNLLKLYLNDVGILTRLLYGPAIEAILEDHKSINLGTVYESVVAQELRAHGHPLYYYDNKQHGEVDFLIKDYKTLSILPIEVKSGKDYKTHSALNTFITNKDYSVKRGIVLSNEREVWQKDNILYLPVYDILFL